MKMSDVEREGLARKWDQLAAGRLLSMGSPVSGTSKATQLLEARKYALEYVAYMSADESIPAVDLTLLQGVGLGEDVLFERLRNAGLPCPDPREIPGALEQPGYRVDNLRLGVILLMSSAYIGDLLLQPGVKVLKYAEKGVQAVYDEIHKTYPLVEDQDPGKQQLVYATPPELVYEEEATHFKFHARMRIVALSRNGRGYPAGALPLNEYITEEDDV